MQNKSNNISKIARLKKINNLFIFNRNILYYKYFIIKKKLLKAKGKISYLLIRYLRFKICIAKVLYQRVVDNTVPFTYLYPKGNNATEISKIHKNFGTPQGDSLSPVLFIIYVEEN